jgi:hypothetical protein
VTSGLVASSTQAGADDMAALEALDPQSRELAVTRWLSEARVSLAHALETSNPAQVANFKAQMATVAEATKQLGLSKEIQLDAVEMVRRAERGVGLAIRKGQDEGSIIAQGHNPFRGNQHGEVVNSEASSAAQPVTDFASKDELGGNGAGIYHLTDDVSDEQFEEALTEAKSEENLSRANVVRKIKGDPSKISGQKRLDRIAELAAKGWTSDRIGKEIGHTEEYTRQLARENGLDINADRVMRGVRRRIDHDRIASNTVTALEGLAIALQLLNIREVDLTHADEWVTSLNASLRSLNRFRNDLIKEMTPA